MVMHTRGHLMMVMEPAKKPIIEPISFITYFLYCLANLLIGITFSIDKIFQTGEKN